MCFDIRLPLIRDFYSLADFDDIRALRAVATLNLRTTMDRELSNETSFETIAPLAISFIQNVAFVTRSVASFYGIYSLHSIQ